MSFAQNSSLKKHLNVHTEMKSAADKNITSDDKNITSDLL
jgi:hypothetical protein